MKKRTKQKACNTCGVIYFLAENRSAYCTTCKIEKENKKVFLRTEATLEFFAAKCEAAGIHKSWWYSEVRSLCRKWNANLQRSCQVCGYSKHVELCHVQPLSSFPRNTKLCVVNDPDNIVVLCPNHHWELDNGLMSIDSIPKRQKAGPAGFPPDVSATLRLI